MLHVCCKNKLDISLYTGILYFGGRQGTPIYLNRFLSHIVLKILSTYVKSTKWLWHEKCHQTRDPALPSFIISTFDVPSSVHINTKKHCIPIKNICCLLSVRAHTFFSLHFLAALVYVNIFTAKSSFLMPYMFFTVMIILQEKQLVLLFENFEIVLF